MSRSLIECSSLCIRSNNCLVFTYNKAEQTCKMGTGQGLQLSPKPNDNIAVHVKDGHTCKIDSFLTLFVFHLKIGEMLFLSYAGQESTFVILKYFLSTS